MPSAPPGQSNAANCNGLPLLEAKLVQSTPISDASDNAKTLILIFVRAIFASHISRWIWDWNWYDRLGRNDRFVRCPAFISSLSELVQSLTWDRRPIQIVSKWSKCSKRDIPNSRSIINQVCLLNIDSQIKQSESSFWGSFSGIGTYLRPKFRTSISHHIAKTLDRAVAWLVWLRASYQVVTRTRILSRNLDQHIMDGAFQFNRSMTIYDHDRLQIHSGTLQHRW